MRKTVQPSNYQWERRRLLEQMDRIKEELKELEKSKTPRHYCGVRGFGLSLDDSCPACEAER